MNTYSYNPQQGPARPVYINPTIPQAYNDPYRRNFGFIKRTTIQFPINLVQPLALVQTSVIRPPVISPNPINTNQVTISPTSNNNLQVILYILRSPTSSLPIGTYLSACWTSLQLFSGELIHPSSWKFHPIHWAT